MSKPVDNSAAKQAARQAQQTSKVQRPGTSKHFMGIGAQPQPSQFGQILQERMGQLPGMRSDDSGVEQEKPQERRPESKESRKSKESAQKQAAHQDRVSESRKREDSREQESREDRGGSQKKDSGEHAKQAEQRVMAKQGQGESSGGKGGQKGQEGRHGAGQQASGQSGAGTGKSSAQAARPEAKPMWSAGMIAQGPAGTATASQAATGPGRIPQRVIEQIVSYARLYSKKDGETELELALHEEIFKGLRMRISTKNGRVKVTFITSSRDVRDLFKMERNSLNSELTENGLAVDGIDVIMS